MLHTLTSKLAIAAIAIGVTFAPTAAAHNAGHVFTPDGSCQPVGSYKPVLAGPDKTPLDLIPPPPSPPYDEVGTSYAAHQGNSAVHPGPC